MLVFTSEDRLLALTSADQLLKQMVFAIPYHGEMKEGKFVFSARERVWKKLLGVDKVTLYTPCNGDSKVECTIIHTKNISSSITWERGLLE